MKALAVIAVLVFGGAAVQAGEKKLSYGAARRELKAFLRTVPTLRYAHENELAAQGVNRHKARRALYTGIGLASGTIGQYFGLGGAVAGGAIEGSAIVKALAEHEQARDIEVLVNTATVRAAVARTKMLNASYRLSQETLDRWLKAGLIGPVRAE
jgi:hypothetical protein